MKPFIFNLVVTIFLAPAVVAAAAEDDDMIEGLGVPAANDREVVEKMRQRRYDDQIRTAQQSLHTEGRAASLDTTPNPMYARADRPRGQPQNAWRYEFYEGRWWYWRADDRWSFYNGRRWVTLPGQASGSRWAKRDRSPGGLSGGGYSGRAGSPFYNPLSAAARNVAGGFNESTSPGIGGALGSEAGALGQGSQPGGGTIPGRVGGTSSLSNRGVGAGASGGPGVMGAGGSMVGGAGGSVGGGAGGSTFGSGLGVSGSRSGDAGSGVGGGSVGGTSVGGGAGGSGR